MASSFSYFLSSIIHPIYYKFPNFIKGKILEPVGTFLALMGLGKFIMDLILIAGSYFINWMKKLVNPTTYFFEQAEKVPPAISPDIEALVKTLLNKDNC